MVYTKENKGNSPFHLSSGLLTTFQFLLCPPEWACTQKRDPVSLWHSLLRLQWKRQGTHSLCSRTSQNYLYICQWPPEKYITWKKKLGSSHKENSKQKQASPRKGSYNFFPRACTVNQIIQQYHFLVSRKPTCRHYSRAFLECKLLVIPVYCLQQGLENHVNEFQVHESTPYNWKK